VEIVLQINGSFVVHNIVDYKRTIDLQYNLASTAMITVIHYRNLLLSLLLSNLFVALKVQDIFRTSGSIMKINQLKQRIDRGEKINYENEKLDPHTVAGLLRLYFRELPNPLVPFEFYQALVDLEGTEYKL
jgi:hypothetical protein